MVKLVKIPQERYAKYQGHYEFLNFEILHS
jgi:hypothetical protein